MSVRTPLRRTGRRLPRRVAEAPSAGRLEVCFYLPKLPRINNFYNSDYKKSCKHHSRQQHDQLVALLRLLAPLVCSRVACLIDAHFPHGFLHHYTWITHSLFYSKICRGAHLVAGSVLGPHGACNSPDNQQGDNISGSQVHRRADHGDKYKRLRPLDSVPNQLPRTNSSPWPTNPAHVGMPDQAAHDGGPNSADGGRAGEKRGRCRPCRKSEAGMLGGIPAPSAGHGSDLAEPESLGRHGAARVALIISHPVLTYARHGRGRIAQPGPISGVQSILSAALF